MALDTLRLIGAIVVVLIAAATLGWRRATSSTEDLLDRLGLERIVVISLRRAANRTQGLLERAATLGLKIELLHATDGALDLEFRSRVLPSRWPESTCADVIGAIFDSHERAWVEAAVAKKPTLVLEDDVLLPPDFVALFEERARELPGDFDVAFAGTSVTPSASRFSAHLSRPDDNDPNLQALLGFWGYVVSPKGAQRLLRLAVRARNGNKRLFQPVDLFIAHRVTRLKVYLFESPPALARWFEQNPDKHHVLSTMRQVGILQISQTPTTNTGIEDNESSAISSIMKQVVQLGEEERYTQAWKVADEGLKKLRRFNCFAIAPFMQNVGLTLLRILQAKRSGVKSLGANKTLLLSLEAFASSVRYTEGTFQERSKKVEFPQWVRHALHVRSLEGFPPVGPERDWDGNVDLDKGYSFDPKTFAFVEPLVRPADRRQAHAEVVGASG